MPYLFGICVFENLSYCRILHQHFWLMQMHLYLDLELGMGNYLGIFLAETWSQQEEILIARIELQKMSQLLNRFLRIGNG